MLGGRGRPLAAMALAFWALFPYPPARGEGDSDFRCGPFRPVGRFEALEINECSGMAVSRKNPGVLWVHNDSGDTARLFAVSEQGRLRGTFFLEGADAVDWEDMALGPCAGPREECLYVGDIGDNRRQRKRIQVYRVHEPSVPLEGPPVQVALADVERFEAKYPDGPHNAETLFVDPAAGIPYLVTKEPNGRPAVVYRFPERPRAGEEVLLERAGTLAGHSPLTGGDVTRDGSFLLLRNYFAAYAFARPAGGPLATAFSRPPRRIPLGAEAQGESLALAPSGTAVYTASEGEGAIIYKAECTLPERRDADPRVSFDAAGRGRRVGEP